MILTADLHLTDAAADDYRWEAFSRLQALTAQHPESDVFILGDLTDRKDRHSAALVNRLVRALLELRDSFGDPDRRIHIIMGNHDQPLRGEPFWSFLSELDGIDFYAEPLALPDRLLLLPFAAKPFEAWQHLKMSSFRGIFCHQPMHGARDENGRKIEIPNCFVFPRGPKIYSGDIHTPQKVGPVQYVGAPHPIKFGDDYECRMLVLAPDFSIASVVPCPGTRKLMLEVDSVEELEQAGAKPGDQVKLRFSLPLGRIEQWPVEREAIAAWAAAAGVTVAAAEPFVAPAERRAGSPVEAEHYMSPESALEAFITAEGLAEQGKELPAMGQALLRRAQDGMAAGRR